MTPPFSNSSKARSGLTFRAAAFFLAAVAAVQAVTAASALRQHHVVQAAASTAPAPAIHSSETAEPDPFSPDELSVSDAQPKAGLSTPELDADLRAVSAEMVTARPVRLAPLDVPIADEACLQHLDEGIYLKEKGDMAGALVELRAALKLKPGHPRLIFHLASTLELMGLDQKARAQWEVLKKMGDGAGDYFEMAVYRLNGGEGETAGAAAAPQAAEEEREQEGRLVFAGVESKNAGGIGEGEVRKFRLTIERRQSEPVDVSKLSLEIHFFDEVNGRRIDRSTTVQPQVQWETADSGTAGADDAVDWKQGKESGDFEYRQPPMNADDVVRFGRRKYLGYVIEMFYNEKLQDVSANVPQLLDFAREMPVDDGAAASEKTAPVSAPGQPDNALFPGDLISR